MKATEYLPTIQRHIEVFRSTEKLAFDRLLRFYQGKFYSDKEGGGPSESELITTSINLTFAIVETAVSTMTPRNPQVTAMLRAMSPDDSVRGLEGVVNLALDSTDYYSELTMLIQDAVLYGRAVIKTTWDAECDLPISKVCDVRGVFYDLAAKRPSDIRYWIETTLLSEEQFRERVASGMYASWANSIHGDTYPKWLMQDTGTSVSRQDLKNFQPWVTVYEVYDVESGRVVHIHPDNPQPLMEDALVYVPFSLLTLNSNGEDCRGLSEISLISDNQEELNHIRTYLLNIARLSIPKVAYDSTAAQSEDMAMAQEAPVGSLTGIRTTNGQPLSTVFHPWPMPEPPAALFEMAASLEKSIATVSALADAQRGQVTGARTATELALVEGQLRNRLAARQRRIDTVTIDVAQKMALLIAKYMANEKVVQLSGYGEAKMVYPQTLDGVKAQFKVVPYSPMESNRAVLQEQFKAAMQFLMSNPMVDQVEVTKQFLEVFSLSPRLFKGPPPPAMPPEAMAGQTANAATSVAAAPPMDEAALAQAAGMGTTEAAPLPPAQANMAEQAAQPITSQETLV